MLLLKALVLPIVGEPTIWLRAGAEGVFIGSWEMSAYVGFVSLSLGVLSLRRGIRLYHVGAFLAAWLMLGNSASWQLSRSLASLPPFDSAWLVFRWRVMLLACLAFAGAAGADQLLLNSAKLDTSTRRGPCDARCLRSLSALIAWTAPLELILLLLPSWTQYVTPERAVQVSRRSLGLPKSRAMIALGQYRGGDPPHRLIFALIHANVGTKAGYEPLFGYGPLRSARSYFGQKRYLGELTLDPNHPERRRAVQPELWSPNRIVVRNLPPGSLLDINLNPGRGWSLNRHAIFRGQPYFVPRARFVVRVPRSGSVDLRYRPPGLITGAFVSAASALTLLALALALGIRRLRNRRAPRH